MVNVKDNGFPWPPPDLLGFYGKRSFSVTIGSGFSHMSSARSASDCGGPVTRKEFRIGRNQGNLARTPDVAVVIHLKLVYGPCE